MGPLLALRCSPGAPRRMCGGCNVEQMIERMPDDAPPKWMFLNISAIRENTDRILEKLESESAPAADDRTRTAA